MPTIHGTAVRLDGAGVLVRGPSGCGKSRLALALLDAFGCHVSRAPQSASPADTALIGDDRLILESHGDRLFASAPMPLAGKLEVRGLGIENIAWVARASVSMVVDIVPVEAIARLPEKPETLLAGHALPFVQVPTGDLAHQCLLVRTALRSLG